MPIEEKFVEKKLSAPLEQQKMTVYQWFTVGMCVFLNIIDGFDVLVMAFTASAISQEWGLSGAQIGFLFSAGLVGMAGGSLFIAPWADKMGRKPIVLICLAVSGVSMLFSAAAASVWQLGILRFITGLGIGGILVSSNVLTSEYASAKWRSLAVSLQSTGYAIGASLGGVLAIYLISQLGWRSVFFSGGLVTCAFVAVAYVWLPESLSFLLVKQPRGALLKANRIHARVGLPQLAALPNTDGIQATRVSGIRSLFAPTLKVSTLAIWGAFFCVMFGFYFIVSWTPKLLASAGMSAEQGIKIGIWLNVGAMFGAILIGYLGTRFNIKAVHIGFLFVTSVLMGVFAYVLDQLSLAVVVGFLLGVLANGAVAGLYAITPTIYDVGHRASGVGAAIGVGRAGGIVSPLVAGVLLDRHWQAAQLFVFYALIFVVAIAMVMLLQRQANKAGI
ncbi:MAG: MFS transporter [Neisseriaceae bacterium]|nr:MFS transporter [Neisseriaceae bacterium]